MRKKPKPRRRILELDVNQVFDELSQARRSIKLILGRLVARYQVRTRTEGMMTAEEDEAVDQVLGELRNALMLLDDVLEHRAAKALKLLS